MWDPQNRNCKITHDISENVHLQKYLKFQNEYERSGEIMQRYKSQLLKLEGQLPRQQQANSTLIEQESST